MSYLIRTGNGRTNISWGGGTTTAAKYLQRTATGRNNIQWIDISTSGTRNILERTSTSGRNNIRWSNVNFSFQTPFEKFASSITWGNIYNDMGSSNNSASLGSWSIKDKSQQIMHCSVSGRWAYNGSSKINFQPYNADNLAYMRTVKQIGIKRITNSYTDNDFMLKTVKSVYQGSVNGNPYLEVSITNRYWFSSTISSGTQYDLKFIN